MHAGRAGSTLESSCAASGGDAALTRSARASWIRAWAPVGVWVGVIFALSSDTFSASSTSGILGPLLEWLLPDASADTIYRLHVAIRKGAHLGVYAVLALLALRNGHAVRLWGIDPPYVAETARTRVNARYLPSVPLPDALLVTSEAGAAGAGATLLVSAVPTQFLRETTSRLAADLPPRVPVVSVSKGLENRTLARPTEILRDSLGPRAAAVLSGPSHAEEVARGFPTSVVVASDDESVRTRVQRVFSCESFRVYASDDVLGVEFAAAVKNVIAIAAGACDGLGLGDNAKAALVTRGNAEMTRLGRALGARAETFAGLAGIVSNLGIDGSKAAMIAPLVLNFLKSRVDPQLLAQIQKFAPVLSGGGGIAGALGGLIK